MEFVHQQCDFGPRPPGSAALEQTRDYIVGSLEEAGWTAEVQDFTYKDTPIHNITAHRGEPGAPLLIAAHYDTRPRADMDPDHPERPILGANDGASGTAVLLELAHAFRDAPASPPVWLVFFDAEDHGRIDDWDWSVGAAYYAQNLQVIPQAVVVVDMVGDADLQLYLEQNSTPALAGQIWDTANSLGYGDFFISEPKWSIIDDHIPFVQKQIPAALLIDFDYPYWHTLADTPDKVSAESLEVVGRTLEHWIETRGQSGPGDESPNG